MFTSPIGLHGVDRDNILVTLSSFSGDVRLVVYFSITRQLSNQTQPWYIHSFSILSDDRSNASSKTVPPHSAI